MVDSIVTRTIGLDFILLDILFLTLWIYYLYKKRYFIPIFYGILGWIIYLGVDWYLWYTVMGSRTYDGPVNDTLFFLWFCLSAGFAQFSYAFVLLERRNFRDMQVATVLYFGGWILVSGLSQLLPISDELIRVSRNMNEGNQRIIFAILVLVQFGLGFFLILIKKIRWQDLIFFFIVGTLVELNLELSLAISGIRLEQQTWTWELFVINTLIEFNVGAVATYLVFLSFKWFRDRHYHPQLGFQDLKHVRTDFNLIYMMEIDKIPANNNHKKLLGLYSKDDIELDRSYISQKYG